MRISTWCIKLVILLFLVACCQAADIEELVPSHNEIESLFEPYSLSPFGEPIISDDFLDVGYTFFQSKSYNPPREKVRIFFRITVNEFEPDEHESEVEQMNRIIKESFGDPESGYGKKEFIDIGEIGYYQEVYDQYAGGQPIGCEIEYITGNYKIWCVYNRKVDPEGYDKNFEDPHEYIQRCIQILKAPEGRTEEPSPGIETSSILFPELSIDKKEYSPGSPFSLTIQVTDENGEKIADVNGLLIFSSGTDIIIPEISFTTDSSGISEVNGIWPNNIHDKVWVRVEVEKPGYKRGSNEIFLIFKENNKTDLSIDESKTKTEVDSEISEFITVRLLLLPIKRDTGSILIGVFEKETNGFYERWHPEKTRFCILKVKMPDERGIEQINEIRVEIEPAGEFTIKNLNDYVDDTELLFGALQAGKWDFMVLN